jgi:DNA-binding Xre family transcriptional regulator
MIRYRIDQLLAQRGWSRYRLAKGTGITEPAVHRLAVRGRAVSRIDARTLEKLCQVFGVGPGDLLEWVPDKRRRGR